MKENLMKWINNIQQQDGVPPKDVIAFNFGIYEDEKGYRMYLVGSFEYDENDDDWAIIELPTKMHRYLSLPKELELQTWEEVLEYCANELKELEKEGKLNIPLFENVVAITIGFDDGDLIRIR
ncbi:hypothetical protein EZJ43_16780 [Pedobacter changchengzhani]|uniref:Uncharacterized protein n=1 Tax=Pedobacter changchengzhani TaxID=2529274 RepID=A0A4R5MH06_9SPHI|nr:hypothetical protein [Pedobacter changchengzhani]TDG34799.1 hypothetical protein EZJ43_16775 [Pedobacter changchengzhani]TDG34800.1 hypothetical protein EZJ43_16780 [Pedobacter changchengzhani]